jgi:HK97 family phage major capsid protein
MKKKFNLFLEEKGISKADFLAKAPAEQGELHNEFQESQFKGLEDLISKKLDSSEIESLKKDGTLSAEIKGEVVRLANELKSLKEVAPVAQFKSVEQELVDQLSLKKSEIDSIKDGDSKKIVLSVKAAATMTTGNVTAVGTGGLSMLLNQFESGITPLPRSAPFFADLFASAPTSGNTISYAEMKNPDGGAGMTGEGSAKTQADFDLVEAKTNVRKITSYIKTSKEALDDIPALAGEINNELVTLIKLKKDSEVLSGAGTGNTLSGVITNATAFTGGALALAVVTPNNYDVLVAGITQIATAEVISGQPAGFMANVIVMNPSDVALMKLTKDANKNYIFPVTLPGSTSVMEVPVISNARMTAGDFLIMDSSKGNLRIKEDITLSVGYENDDFTKNLVTILAEMRLAFYIKSQHVKAFVKGTFSTAITALTKA